MLYHDSICGDPRSLSSQEVIDRLTAATPELRESSDSIEHLVSEYVTHFSQLAQHGETAEIRECASQELADYFEMLSNGGVN